MDKHSHTKPLAGDVLFATLTRVKESLPAEAQALADHIGARAQAVTALVKKLKERADWLDYEIRHGGSLEHLSARHAECKYITELVTALSDEEESK